MKQLYQKILSDKKLLGLYVLVEIIIAYVLASYAIDTAKIILYVLTFVLVVDILSKTNKILKKVPKTNAKNKRTSPKKA